MHQSLIEGAINIDRRLRIRDRIRERTDILDHAEKLIEWQNGTIPLSQIPLSKRDLAFGRYVSRTIGAPSKPEGEESPVGSKLPLLYFSPLYHLHAAKVGNAEWQRGSNPALPHLPKTHKEIEAYLHAMMSGAFRGQKEFRFVTGAKVEGIAPFLMALRRDDPTLFLLLLSEEIDLAVKRLAGLDYSGGRKGICANWRARYFPDIDCSIASIFRILRTIRRGCSILVELADQNDFTLSELKQLSIDIECGRPSKRQREHLGRILHSVIGLRKIACIDIDRHGRIGPKELRFRRYGSDYRTYHNFERFLEVDSSHHVSARYVRSCVEDSVDQLRLPLPVADRPGIVWPQSSDIDIRRVDVRGGLHRDKLSNFYGLDDKGVATQIAHAVYELSGKPFRPQRLANFSNRLLEATDCCGSNGADLRDFHLKDAGPTGSVLFGKPGGFNNSAGFSEASWHDLEGDQAVWELLVTANWSKDQTGRMFLEGRRYLFSLTNEVKRLGKLEQSTRIFCYLAQCMSLFSTDPIWIRILERSRALHGLTLRQKGTPLSLAGHIGAGPKTFGDLLMLLEPPLHLRRSRPPS